MKRIAVFASGGGTNFQAILDACQTGTIQGEIVLLVYNRKNAFAKMRAQKAGIPSVYINKLQYKNKDLQADAILTVLNDYAIDLMVLAGYLDILHPTVTAQYQYKIINTHPALIPSFCGMGYYGEKVHRAVIDYGVKVSGCTIHFATEQADAGPVILQGVVDVKQNDTPQSLAARILPLEHTLLVQAVKLFCEDKIHVTARQTVMIDDVK